MVFSSLRTQSAEALSTLRPQLRKRKHCDGFDRSSASKYLGKRKEGCVEAVTERRKLLAEHCRQGKSRQSRIKPFFAK